jgi:hypothetical protein
LYQPSPHSAKGKSRYGLTVVGSGVSLIGKEEFQPGECDVVVISATLKDAPLRLHACRIQLLSAGIAGTAGPPCFIIWGHLLQTGPQAPDNAP